ncbi:hypothetical protein ACS86_17860 [Vibrio alginolyticus]|nr:hypothetical protein ACS86_17860 [Vibrio alginolyticus]
MLSNIKSRIHYILDIVRSEKLHINIESIDISCEHEFIVTYRISGHNALFYMDICNFIEQHYFNLSMHDAALVKKGFSFKEIYKITNDYEVIRYIKRNLNK